MTWPFRDRPSFSSRSAPASSVRLAAAENNRSIATDAFERIFECA